MNKHVRWYAALLVVLGLAACSREKTSSPDQVSASSLAPQSTPAPADPPMHIDSNRAWQYTKEIVALGPRWDGSPGQKKMGEYLHAKLKNDTVEEDAFIANTPEGKFEMRNIIAKFPGTKDGIIVLGSHIDTCYWLRKTGFVGANDGASSTALLLAIADRLRGKKLEGYSVWLAFLDGEEAIRHWTAEDSLYGSKHLAQKWQQEGTSKQIKAFLLADMIGDSNLDIMRDTNSTSWLEDLVLEAATRLSYQSYFFAQTSTIEDDHLPFARAGVPVADVIDIDYGPNNSYHHTIQDTLDKLSTKSLQITGDVFLETIRLLNAGAGPATPKS